MTDQTESKLTIGIVGDDSLDRPDGVQQYELLLGEWERQQGHEVHYITSDTVRTGIPNIHSVTGNIGVTFNGNRLGTPGWTSKKTITQLLGRLQLDVLHVQMPYSPLMAGRIIRAAAPETAVVGTFHILPTSSWTGLGSHALSSLQRGSLKRFDSIMACSEPAQQFAKQVYGVDAKVVPNPVDLAAFRKVADRPRPADKPPTIAFLGRLVDRKGCQYLIEALHQLRAEHPELAFRAVIAGSGQLEQSLRRKSQQYQLEQLVTFAGFIDETVKPAFLHDADIAVFPAKGGESFGIVLTEAMAAGAGVVLAGNNPGYASVMEQKSDFLFKPDDTRELMQKLVKLLQNPEWAHRLHEQQQAMVEQYDIERVGPQVMEVYRQAIAKRRGNADNKDKQ